MQALAKSLCAGTLMLGLSMCAGVGCESDETAKTTRDGSAASGEGDEQTDSQRDASADASRERSEEGGASSPGAMERDDAAAEPDEEEDAGSVDEPTPEADGGEESSDGAAPQDSDAATAPSTGALELSSSVVEDGELLDAKYRCEADSPPLAWTAGPEGTRSFAVVFQDQVNSYYHWLIYDIAEGERALPMGVPVGAEPAMPSGAKQGPSWNRVRGYGGPCAPERTERTYTFTIYALDVATLPGLSESATASQIVSAIKEHELANSTLTIRSMLP